MNTDETIQLDQFLKFAGLADTGGQAKMMIRDGEVRVNGEVELRRGRKLRDKDEVEFDGDVYLVEFEPDEDHDNEH